MSQGHNVFINHDLKHETLMWIRSFNIHPLGRMFLWNNHRRLWRAVFICGVSCHIWLMVVCVCLVLCSAVEFSELANLEWVECESIALLKICGPPVTRAELNWAERTSASCSLVPIRGAAIKCMWNHMLQIVPHTLSHLYTHLRHWYDIYHTVSPFPM